MKRRSRIPVIIAVTGTIAFTLVSILPSPPATPGSGALVARFGWPSEAFARLRRISVTSTTTAFSRFSPVLGLHGDARIIEATGPFACDPGETWQVDIVISQGDAMADGHKQGTCSGELGTWTVTAEASGTSSFAAGPAEGCGTISTQADGTTTDSFEWCGDFLLESTTDTTSSDGGGGGCAIRPPAR